MARIEVIDETCKGCQLCVPVCPKSLIFYTKSLMNHMGFYPVEYRDPEQECNGCKLCAIICPDIAIKVYK